MISKIFLSLRQHTRRPDMPKIFLNIEFPEYSKLNFQQNC